MASEIEKREKARRVWRLNKKEGIPVLEALDSVDIGKDAYYRIKDEREGEWEEEVLTAEQVQEELEELRESIAEIQETADGLDEKIEGARQAAEKIEQDANWYDRVADVDNRLAEVEIRLDKFAEAVGYDFFRPDSSAEAKEEAEKQSREARRVSFGEIYSRIDRVEQEVSTVKREVEPLEKQIRETKREAFERVRNVEKKIPESIWELV